MLRGFFITRSVKVVGFLYGENRTKEERQRNWELLKTTIDSANEVLLTGPLEVYVEPTDNYAINERTVTINGINKETSKIICYPIAKRGGDSHIFSFSYASSFTLKNCTLKLAAKSAQYETYNATLKFGGNVRKIKLSGDIRPEFWSKLQAGDTILYSWNPTVLGKTGLVSSFDSGLGEITLTADIDASVSSGMSGLFGQPFEIDVTKEDYEAYGQGWVYEVNRPHGISCAPGPNSGTPFNFILENAGVENFYDNIQISAGNGMVTINGESNISNSGSVGMSFFGRNNAGHKLLQINDTLIVSNCGTLPVGSITFITGPLGGGIYFHPNIQIHGETLLLTDNIAASCRQYTSSGSILPVEDGAYTEIQSVICTNSGEYDMLLSNVMPTTLHEFIGDTYLWANYDLIINSGVVNDLYWGLSTSLPVRSYLVQFNNIEFTGGMTGVNPNLETVEIEFNNSIFVMPPLTAITWVILAQSIIDKITISNCTVEAGSNSLYTPGEELLSPPKTKSAAFMANLRVKELILDNVVTEQFFGEFVASFPQQLTLPYRNHSLVITDSDIRMSQLSLTSNVVTSSNVGRSNSIVATNTIILTCNQGLGYTLPQKIGGKAGVISKSIVSSETYSVAPQTILAPPDITPINILEIDWSHDEYETNGTINHIAPILYYQQWRGSCSNQRQGQIKIRAVGGDIIINDRDESTNPYGNINASITIPNGTFRTFEVDGDAIITNAASTLVEVQTGVTTTSKIINGHVPEGLCLPGVSTVTIGAVVGTYDADGNITGTGIDDGFFDFGSGSFYVLLTDAPTNGTAIEIEYHKVNQWRGSGIWNLVD